MAVAEPGADAVFVAGNLGQLRTQMCNQRRLSNFRQLPFIVDAAIGLALHALVFGARIGCPGALLDELLVQADELALLQRRTLLLHQVHFGLSRSKRSSERRSFTLCSSS